MNPILINPKIDSSASTTEQLGQMKSYLRQFKEQIELILMNIDSDNMSEKFQDEVYEGMSKKIMGDKTISEIAQTAGMIKMSVKDLEGSVASLTLTTSGIQTQVTNEVNRATGAEQALSSSISQTAGQISLKVDKSSIVSELNSHMGSGIIIDTDYISIQSDGALIINTSQFDLDEYGNASFGGELSAPTGTIGGFEITSDTLQTDPDSVSSSYGGVLIKSGARMDSVALAIGYTDPARPWATAGFAVNGTGGVDCGVINVGSLNVSSPGLFLTYYQSDLQNHIVRWKRLNDCASNEWVLAGGT